MRHGSRRRLALLVVALLLASAAPAYATQTVSPDPVLILRSFKTTPSTLSVGSRFRLELSIDNAVDVEARNVVVTLGTSTLATSTTTPEGPHAVVLGSNTKFIGTISGNAKNQKVTFDLVSNPQGGPGPFMLPVAIEFDSNNGGRGRVDQSVGLMLTRTLVFDVGALTYPREATATVPFQVSVSVRNTNEFAINGVAIAFSSAETSWTSAETTVGVLDPGKTATLVGTGIPLRAGPLQIAMVLRYKDDYNQEKQIRRDFTIEVKAKPAAPKQSDMRPATTFLDFIAALFGVGG